MLCHCGKPILNVMPHLHDWAHWECKDCAGLDRRKQLQADKDWYRKDKQVREESQ